MSIDVNPETRGFQAEVQQLLHLMVHSLYGNKEIFLRELISNASDAADKLRFEALGNDQLFEGDSELGIEVDFSESLKTITIRDNGIGMSRQEAIDNLGTIAKSGTREFFKTLTGNEQKDSQLIGQFGVGFYSAFIVADEVTVTTRRAGLPPEQGVRWQSKGSGDYTIQSVQKNKRGTEVVLHLREGEEELLNGYRLRSIIHRYSDHIALPIMMPKEDKETPGYERVNNATALWTRAKNDISEDEYTEFYKHIAHDFEAPLARVHSKVEGNLEYTMLFFIPARAPFDLWDRDVRRGVKLYVRRVFIMDDAEQLLPRYLRFVRGVVDSNDLPLNVSREILQQNKAIETIRGAAVKKILGVFEDLVGKGQHEKVWSNFGRVIKEGVIEDFANRDRIAKLLRFSSTHDEAESQNVSLEGYVKRMPDGQKHIYYAIAEGYNTARNSPHLEIFRKNAIEVLLLWDPIDEWLVTHLREYDGKELKSISKGDLDLGSIYPASVDVSQDQSEFQDLASRLQKSLEGKVKAVRITHRLTSSPACLVADEHEMGMNLERILKAAGQSITTAPPILEINPTHPLIIKLNVESEGARFDDWAHVLFDQALLSEGGKLDDPAGFVHRLNQLFIDVSTPKPSGAG